MAHLLDKCIISEDVRSALDIAREMSRKDDIILITGSLYTVGEAKKLIDEVF